MTVWDGDGARHSMKVPDEAARGKWAQLCALVENLLPRKGGDPDSDRLPHELARAEALEMRPSVEDEYARLTPAERCMISDFFLRLEWQRESFRYRVIEESLGKPVQEFEKEVEQQVNVRMKEWLSYIPAVGDVRQDTHRNEGRAMSESDTNDAAPQRAPSQENVESNRPSGPQAPGSRTRREKAVGNRNALKYGLTTSRVVIERIDGEGAWERFAALHKSLRKHFMPEDPISEFRVQRVVANLWRLDRHDRAEAAMLEEASLRAAEDDLLRRFRLPGILNEAISGTTAATEPNSHRLRVLIDRLGELEEEIRRDGGLSEQSLRDLMKTFGTSDPFAVECAVRCVSANAADPASNGGPDASSGALPDQMEQAALLMSEKRQQLSELQPELERLEQQQRAAHLVTLGIPSPVNFAKVWRSRVAINKELEQDLAHLTRRPHRGKKNLAVPAPRGELAGAKGLE